jgi:hypothetical protein
LGKTGRVAAAAIFIAAVLGFQGALTILGIRAREGARGGYPVALGMDAEAWGWDRRGGGIGLFAPRPCWLGRER